jgi:predicted Rossmann fold flavoprotein
LIASLGHNIAPPVPSLFTFKITDARIAELAGVSVARAGLRLLADTAQEKLSIAVQSGPLLITHWGLSGPATLRLSAWGARWLFEHDYQAGLLVNWLYPLSTEKVLEELTRQKNIAENSRKKTAAHVVYPEVPTRLWKRLCEAAGISELQNWADVSKLSLRRLAEELTAGRYRIEGKGIFKDEFVTCGGVELDEVDFKSMQSRLVPGLFFAGEVLDIDGLTGGFNFQNAWTTGWLAGGAMARM